MAVATLAALRHATPIVDSALSYRDIDNRIAAPLLEWKYGRAYWIFFVASGALTVGFFVGVIWLFVEGIGILGNNTAVVWGVPIASYVWWIGIGNAGTLISSMLLLTHQHWRASINRSAEAMTLFAVTIAGLFPILHLGRPWFAYWLAPYPNTMALWPQWRSALVWDFWAIASYLLFSIMFWYIGLVPDLATLRDRAERGWRKLTYGALALGWQGSASAWHHHGLVYRAMAALAVPLVISVHSIVGLDFAASLMPGWQESLFPPYFVVGAMFSGFAMVVDLTLLLRWGLGLQSLITRRHIDAMGKILLTGSIVMAFSYLTEWFMAWYSGEPPERSVVLFALTGHYAPLYWAMLLCNCLVPQALWSGAVRRNLWAIGIIAVLVNIGMYLERIMIIFETLSRGYLPSMWRIFHVNLWDMFFVLMPLGFFAFLFACFVRLVPTVSMHEVKALQSSRAGR
ncbi:MAG: NrfD/PsrC family molybdoenzyme membrane anchor subunit [Geminicoccaceae bacterium]